MANSIRLPASAPINTNIIIPGTKAPYFTVWFQDNRLPGETPSQFLVRVLSPSVIDYVASKQTKLLSLAADTDIKATTTEAAIIKAEP